MAFTTGKQQTRPVDRLFPGRREAIANKQCMRQPLGCGEEAGGFRDEVSRREYAISALCQVCQDKLFSKED